MSARADMAQNVAELKAQGYNGRQIAERLEISRSYAYELLIDPEGLKVRARKEGYRGTCKTCGDPTDGSNGRSEAPDMCLSCTARRNEERNRRIFDAIANGEPSAAIARREGMTASAIDSLADAHRRIKGEPIACRRRSNRSLWPQIEQLWNDGETAAEIADALDTTPENVTRMVFQMRRHGIDLPYRLRRAA